MSFIEITLALTGAIAIGYGITGLVKQRVEIYTRGQIRLYEGTAARLIGIAFLMAGLGAFSLGYFGISTPTMIFGILCTGIYFGARHFANQEQDKSSENSFTLPSQRDQE